MSHHYNDNNIALIIILCILFPGVALALGAWVIILAILKVILGAILIVGYFIYKYIWWSLIIGFIIFIYYFSSKKTKIKQNINGSTTVIKEIKSVNYYPKDASDEVETFIDERVTDIDSDEDSEINELMENNDLDRDEAEHVKEIMDENDLDEDEAMELKDYL